MPEQEYNEEQVAEILQHVYIGKLDNLPSLASKIVRIFTSSTFTDTSMERNSLMQHTYPKLKEYCREKHGLEFQVVDMRWGVRDEATDDHKTTELCMQEIDNCQRVSVGPNFVVFLCQKYGYRPLPTKIEEGEFSKVISVSSTEDAALLKQWYKLDSNNIPSLFCLQPVSSIFTNFTNRAHPRLMEEDQSSWWETMGKLNRAVRVAALELYKQGLFTAHDNHRYNWSVTEQEVVRGILNAKDIVEHTLAFFRHIDNINIDLLRHSMKFIDITAKKVDVEAQNMLSDLRDVRVAAALPESSIVRYTVEWSDDDGLNKNVHAEYLKDFIETFYRRIVELIDNGVRKQNTFPANRVFTEILQNLHVVNNFSQDFQGRTDILERIRNYVQGSSKQPLVLWGEGGCGKSSMLAKIASEYSTWFPTKNCSPIRVVRFLGTTPDSSSIGPLLRSICQQLCRLYQESEATIPNELSQLINYFKRLLGKTPNDKPLCIFLDSLDQISSSDGAHSMSWLPPTLPNHVKLIVSTLPGIFNILNTLRNIIDTPENFVQIKPLGEDLGKIVLKAWLARHHRTISDVQWLLVHERLTECNTPLYVKLVFDEIKLWKSYTKTQEKDLAKTVSTSINKLLGRIENQHGHILVEHALSYITASRSGLSEAELEDLISLDETVLNDIYQYHLPPIRRIPPLLWTRIRNDIPNYLVEREAEGVSVVSWYHRQFAEVSHERYLANPEERRRYHSQMADYFLGIWANRPKPFQFTDNQKRMFNLMSTDAEADRKVPAQPLIFTAKKEASTEAAQNTNASDVRYNLRKLSELPFQLIQSEREDDLYNHVLFNYDFIHAKLSCMPLNSCIYDYESAFEYIHDKEVKLMSDGLRLSSSVLAADPNNLACQIIGRLLPFYTTCPKIASFIDQCESIGLQHMGLVPAFNTLASPGGPLVYSLEAHQFAVYGLEVISSGQHLLTVSNKFIVFDLSSGDTVRIVDPKIEGIMTYLSVAPDQRYCVAITISNQYIICNLLTGEYILRDYQTPGSSTKPQTKSIFSSQPADPLLGAAVSNTHFALWTSQMYQVYTKKGELLTSQPTRYQIIQIELLPGPEVEIVCRSEEIKPDQEVARDRLIIDYCFVTNPDHPNETIDINNNEPRCLTGGRKNIHSALILTRDKRRMYTCCEINDYNVEMYVNKPHPINFKTQRIWAFDHQLFENKDRIFAFILSNDENYLMAVTFKGFKIFSFRSYLWKTCALPGGVRNIISGTKRLIYTAVFSHDNRYCIACVKSTVYVFAIEWGELVASFDSHFGRILVLKGLLSGSGGNNYVITTGMDKTTKVWNLENAREKDISITQLDKALEMMHISTDTQIIMAQTRTQLCLFDMKTGFIKGQLIASPHGSIYQCTAMCTNGLFAVTAESGNLVVWDIEERRITFITKIKNIFQLLLHTAETMVLVVSFEPIVPTNPNAAINANPNLPSTLGQIIHAVTYTIPDGDLVYERSYTIKRMTQPKKSVCTAEDTYLIFIEEKKTNDVLSIHDPISGEHIHNVKLTYNGYKDIISMVTIPKQPHLIGLIDADKGVIMNVRDKRVHLVIPKWGGQISSDGKYGLYAPTRGGLEIFELRNAKVVRTLIGKVAEGVFDVLAFFTPTNNHVIYYNKGKRTIRVFRTADGQQIADMKCPAKVRQAMATQDGQALVVGYEDGAVQMFLIVDNLEPASVAYLKAWRKHRLESHADSTQTDGNDKPSELDTK
ncbi:unnamed protein product [Adineta steineri]|uniref:Uncharacterized protein n=1 Tax=Adineta steineri TaxID=433720 RepID=A0A814YY47_9BILA|nr:unnamed protein product [Adineta steineri]CAF3676298.1 unnamed protein product [Adineta steineri]